MIGETLGKYHIIEHLGSGSMADVYKAYQPALDRYVAVKVLHSFLADEEDFLTRFQREARTVAMLRHPNIIQVYDCDFDPEKKIYYIVVEFVDGPSLKTRLQELAQEGQLMPLEEAVQIAITMASALDYAHRRGTVHRDIKPANIVFAQDGQVILTDFGIAKILNATSLTATGAMVGTPAYMAPELGMGQVGNGRADIYSLGVLLYQLVTGQLPFDADTPLGVVLKHINEPLTRPTAINPDLPPAIEAVIMRTMAKKASDRYQTAGDFADDLERAMAGEPVEPFDLELTIASAVPDGLAVAREQEQRWEQPTVHGAPGDQAAPATPSPLDALIGRLGRRGTAVLAGVLMLILLGCAAMLATGLPAGFLTALFPGTATPVPSVIGTPTPSPTPDLTATYDAVATQFAAMLATYVATTGVTPTPSSTPTSTPTPDLTATALAACTFDMQVVNDRPIWPTVLRPGQQVVKRWEVRNTGTCRWPDDVRLAFVSGEEFEVVGAEPEIEPLAPGETAEIAITLKAPRYYNRYASTWQLQDGQGNPIGEALEIALRVGPTPTPRPTATPTGTPMPLYSPTPMAPLRVDSVGIGSWDTEEGGVWIAELYVVARGGDGKYRFYRDVVAPETEFFAPNPNEPWLGILPGVRAQKCEKISITFWVTSAGAQAKWEGFIPYPDMSDCR